MIDLHLHLDGSLSEEDFKYLASKHNIDLGSDFPNNIYVPENCSSLEEYLERFDLPLRLMQDAEDIEYVAYSLVKRLHQLGYIYAEIRFAPQLHLEHGLSQKDVVASAIKGLERGLSQCPGFDANFILCCMRQAEEKINIETIEVANIFKGKKVVAVDLAGPEKLYDANHFINVFNLAKKYNLNMTLHAGEATGSDEVLRVIDLGASRVGHGVHLSTDFFTMTKIAQKHIFFEFCPTSNLQTKSLKNYTEVPLKVFLNFGIPVTINSDNMTVSNTNVMLEMKRMKDTFNLSKEEVYQLLYNSIQASFITINKKMELLTKLQNRIQKFYLSF
ncbi:MAG: adenosine deaminase [Bacilli bacterium]|nr:adenosine deaminase [Bacilli bacterium]